MIVEEFLTGLNLRGKSYSSYLYYLKKFKELGMKSELIDSFESIYSNDKNINILKILINIDKNYK